MVDGAKFDAKLYERVPEDIAKRLENVANFKKVTSKLPDVLGAGGLAASLTPLPVLGPIAGGGGAALGTMFESLANSTVDNLYAPKSGIPKTAEENKQSGVDTLNRLLGKTGTYASLGLLTDLLKNIPTMVQPGKARQRLIEKLPDSKKLVPRDALQERLVGIPDKYVTPEAQSESRDLINQLYTKMFPFQGSTTRATPTSPSNNITSPQSVNLNDLYKNIYQLEAETRPFNTGSNRSLAGKDISLALRELANEQGGPQIQRLNDYMSASYKLSPIKKTIGSGVALGTGYTLLNALKKLVGL